MEGCRWPYLLLDRMVALVVRHHGQEVPQNLSGAVQCSAHLNCSFVPTEKLTDLGDRHCRQVDLGPVRADRGLLVVEQADGAEIPGLLSLEMELEPEPELGLLVADDIGCLQQLSGCHTRVAHSLAVVFVEPLSSCMLGAGYRLLVQMVGCHWVGSRSAKATKVEEYGSGLVSQFVAQVQVHEASIEDVPVRLLDTALA
jgi:hypothetical protein